MKGISFNVTLSEEQIEHIASLSADKINYTIGRLKANDEYYISEIERLKNSLSKRNELIVGKELYIDRLMTILKKQEEEIENLKTNSSELVDSQVSVIRTIWELAQGKIDTLYSQEGAEEEKQAIENWITEQFPLNYKSIIRAQKS